ncbi:glycosyltransferase [Streptomyces capparidis]
MKVVHVVTLVSDDGAYGGPVSVACGQLAELGARGHEVRLLSLWRGRGAPPDSVDGVPLLARRARTLVPGQGFLGLLHPRLLVDLWRSAGRADVLHVHAGRDLVSLAALAAAVLRRRRFVTQTHGMVQPRSGPVARAFDAVYAPLLRRARACFVLTEQERAGLAEVLGPRRPPLVPLPNGVRVAEGGSPADPPVVLYLARLHPRKRPEAFVEMAGLLRESFPGARFVMHGSDEGSLPVVEEAVRRLGLEKAVVYEGALDHAAAVRTTARASVYVLPSVHEPFPMSVLEALAVGTPVVCTSSCGIASELVARGAALVTDGSPAALAEAVRSVLTDGALRDRLVEAGREAVREVFSVGAVADRLEEEYVSSG